MNTNTELRKVRRFDHKTTVMLENEPSGQFSYAQMINFSGGGMGFGSDFALRPGTIINIRLDKPIFRSAPKTYSAIVRWCKQLSDDNLLCPYGVGVEYC